MARPLDPVSSLVSSWFGDDERRRRLRKRLTSQQVLAKQEAFVNWPLLIGL